MKQKKLVVTLVAGIIALLIAMGIGRFSYTPLLPYMKESQGFSETMAGYLASSNYFGYLLGALFTGAIRWGNKRTFYFRISLMVNILTTGFMGCTTNEAFWLLWRFLSGVSSAMVFVLVSGIVLDQLAHHQRMSWAGFFYSGVGWGIFWSGLLVPYFVTWLKWDGAWLGLMVFSFLIGLVAWLGVKETDPSVKSSGVKQSDGLVKHNKKQLIWLMAAYGCEGLGYIVTGTFLVAMAANIPTLAQNPTISWMIAGLAAIPSCIFWAWIAKHRGYPITLILTYLIQAVGVLLPALYPNAIGIYLGAFLFGGTFMGITTLATSMGREIDPQRSSRVIGYLTAIYGMGQILGPIGAGMLAEKTSSYTSSLFAATAILLLGVMCLSMNVMLSFHEKKKREVSI